MKPGVTYHWHEEAVCQRLPAAMAGADFYPTDRRSAGARLAKQVCGICPVRTKCLDFALENAEPYGIWAGTDPKERAWLLNPTTEDTDAQAR